MKLYISYNPAGFETDPTAMSAAIQNFFEELRGVQMAPRMDNDFVWWLFRKQTETVSLYVKGSNIVVEAPSTEAIIAFILTYLSGYDLPDDQALLRLLSPSMNFQDIHKLWRDALPDIDIVLIG
jgi:hypothetical protein